MDKIYQKLEFYEILNQVAKLSYSSKAATFIKSSQIKKDYDLVVNELKKTDEVMQLSVSYGAYSLDGFADIDQSLERVNNHQTLSGLELVEIANQQSFLTNLNNYQKQIDDKDKYPYFVKMVKDLESIYELAKTIDSKIASNGLVYEDASQNLVSISAQISDVTHKLNAYLNGFIQKNSEHLMDNVVTYRNNRAVVMVKQASKNIIKGIIHDESSSKQTAFIEPTQVVEYNNKLQNLEYQRNAEIEIILKELSELVKENHDVLLNNFEIIVELDIVKAKALYTASIDGIIPTINQSSAKLEIYQGRHPLIDKDKVIANDFFIANNETKYRIVLISGSNTGGKTVALKMVGLFALMAQNGIGISAKENSNLPIYHDIFVDIGDEQSIENSLSTFSSRLNNVIEITEKVSAKSLVLFDELGSGTDPREGENLALAILEYLYAKDASVIITTHYSKLKNWAITSNHVRSASVVFDEQTSKPQYKLVFDTFASSNAFEIALNLGLSQDIVNQAKKLYSQDLNTSDELLLKLEEKQQETRLIQEQLNQQIKDYEKRNQALVKAKEKLDQDAIKVIEKAQDQANAIVAKASDESAKIIKELKKQDNFVNHEVNKLTKGLDELYEIKQVKETNDNHQYEVGDLVELVKLNRQGTITQINGKNSFEITIGNVKTKAKKSDIRFVSKNQQKVAEKKIKAKRHSSKRVNSELNLIGLRAEEAIRILNKYLDDALLANVNTVRVVHGFGTGALRKAVHETLKKNKHVKSFHFAEYNEGGQGATIVNFK